MTERVERMVQSAPIYYQHSAVYEAIQAAKASEYDTLEANEEDLRKQLPIVTATWGLRYWEELLKIPIVTTDSYDIRRSRVLSKWRGYGQFSAKLIKDVCEAFTGGEVAVALDTAAQSITVTFVGKKGIPENLDDLKAAVDNVVHAHLGTTYVFTYLTWDALDAANLTWDQLDALGLTWDQLEVYTP